MLITPSRTEERIWQYVRRAPSLRITPDDAARAVGGDANDVRLALDELVARNELRRHDLPGGRTVYWS